jgi:DNA-binding FadR family transcriptional regulator
MEAITSGDAHQARIVAEEHIHDLKQFVIKLEDEI